jgi:hypothetical protein
VELKASKREERETERLPTSGRRGMVRASFTQQMTTVDDRLVPPTSTCAAHDSIHSFIHNHDSAQHLFALESSRRSKRPRIMWNDEDNNPYGTSFERRDSTASSTVNPNSPGSRELFRLLASTGSQDDGLNMFR